MKKLFNILNKNRMIIFIPLFLILVWIVGFQLYEAHFRCNITAKFAESGPLYINMPIYYKGYKIGYTKDIELSKDYEYTLVKIVLYPREPKFPKNIFVKVKKNEMRKDYLELIIPGQPSVKLLTNGSIIDGEPAFDLETFLMNIVDSGALNPLIDSFIGLLSSFGATSDEIRSFFSDSHLILNDNRQNLKHTTKSLAKTTKSLTEITSKLNNSIKEEQLNNTMFGINKSSDNILTASENIKNITVNVDAATKNLDETRANIDSTISNANASASNVKNITRGLCEVLGKRFAGLRIFFGRPIKKNACPKNCPP